MKPSESLVNLCAARALASITCPRVPVKTPPGFDRRQRRTAASACIDGLQAAGAGLLARHHGRRSRAHAVILTGALGAALLLAVAPARAEMPAGVTAALNKAPADAEAIVVVPSLNRLSDQIANLRQELGLPVPDLDDVLGNFKRQAGMVEGVNDDGTLIIALSRLAETAGKSSPDVTMLVPVSDYAAFVRQFGGGEDGAATAVQMPDGGPGFACRSGDHAVLCKTRELAEAYAPGQKAAAIGSQIGKLGNRYLGEGQIAIYVDAEVVGPTLIPLLDDAIGEAAKANRGTPMGEQQEQMARMFGEAARVILSDARSMLAVADLGEAAERGVALTMTLGVKPDSTLAGILPGSDTNPAALTASLPDQPFIMATSMDLRGIDLSTLMDRLMAHLPEAGENPMLAMYKEALPLIKQTRGAASVFYPPPGPEALMTGNVFNSINVYEVENGAAYLDALKDYMKKLDGIAFPMPGAADAAAPGPGPGGGAPAAMTYHTRYVEGALAIDGVRVDQYEMNVSMPPEVMQGLAQAGPFAGMFMGAMNYKGYVAARDNRVLMTTTLDPQQVTRTLASVQARTGIGAQGPVAEVREAAMPPGTVLEAFVSIDGVARTVGMFMPGFEAPPGLEPICFGAGIEDEALAVRTYLPKDSIKYIVETAMSFQGVLGGEPGGPGMQQQRPGVQPPPFN